MKNSIYSILILTLFACQTKEKRVARTSYQQWHTIALDVEGAQTSETADENPFLNYRLMVEFEYKEATYAIRDFYAADGDAAETSAEAVDIWQVRFTPDKIGEWLPR